MSELVTIKTTNIECEEDSSIAFCNRIIPNIDRRLKELEASSETIQEYVKTLAMEDSAEKKAKLRSLTRKNAVRRYIGILEEKAMVERSLRIMINSNFKMKYENCPHDWFIWTKEDIITPVKIGSRCGCAKCGLDESIKDEFFHINPSDITPEQQAQFNYLRQRTNSLGRRRVSQRNDRVLCYMPVAKAILTRIEETHPGIDDKLAFEYFKCSLHNIRTKNVTAVRREGRAKRLKLSLEDARFDERSVYVFNNIGDKNGKDK